MWILRLFSIPLTVDIAWVSIHACMPACALAIKLTTGGKLLTLHLGFFVATLSREWERRQKKSCSYHFELTNLLWWDQRHWHGEQTGDEVQGTPEVAQRDASRNEQTMLCGSCRKTRRRVGGGEVGHPLHRHLLVVYGEQCLRPG